MNRPMIWAVVPYMLGIAVADTGWFPFWLALAACVALPAAAYVLKASRTVTLMPVLFGLGFANQAFHLSQIPADDLRNQLGDGQQIVTLTGRLATTPEHRVSEINGEEYWRSMVELAVSEIETDTGRSAAGDWCHSSSAAYAAAISTAWPSAANGSGRGAARWAKARQARTDRIAYSTTCAIFRVTS